MLQVIKFIELLIIEQLKLIGGLVNLHKQGA